MSKTDLTYEQETQTLVGVKSRTLIDSETGEVINVDQVTKRVYGTKPFWKIYLMDFLAILGIIDSRQLDVLVYVLENTNPATNLFIGTYSKIGQKANVSKQTIATTFKKLKDNNLITRVQNGVWAVNPNIIMKGSDFKKGMLIKYQEDLIQTKDIEGQMTIGDYTEVIENDEASAD